MSVSYAKKIDDAKVMLSGINTHKQDLDARGINDPYIQKLTLLIQACVDINNTQEKAKADLATLTQSLNEQIAELDKEMKFCKRVVMSDIPTQGWREFGMVYRPRKPKPEGDTPTDEEENTNPAASEKKEPVKTQS